MRRKGLMATACAAGIGLAGPAAAQTAEPGHDNEIIVTAQKRSQNINDVGMAITAVNSATLKAAGITQVADLTRLEPSLQFAPSPNDTPVYTLRGIGYNEQSLAATPAVSIYQDEVPFPLSPMAGGALLDPERVEVLKGPQGTLFGQNSTGGAINFIAAKPTSSFSAGIDGSWARFNATELDGYVSGPITSTLNARLAGSIDEGGAWQKSRTRSDTLGSKDKQVGRLLLDWQPTARLKVSTNINGWVDHSQTQAAQLTGIWFASPGNISPDALTPASANFRPNGAYFATYPAAIQALVQQPTNPTNDRQADWDPGTHPHNDEAFYQGTLRADYEVADNINLTSITSYQHYRQHNTVDQGGAGLPDNFATLDGRANSFYQELRVGGKFWSNKGSWIIGANYEYDTNHENDVYEPVAFSPVYSTGGSQFSAFDLGSPITSFGAVNNVRASTKSVFAHVEYPILSTVMLNGGIRYTRSDQTMSGCGTGSGALAELSSGLSSQLAAAFGGSPPTPITGTGQQCTTFGPAPDFQAGLQHNKLDQSNVPWRAGLDWHLAKNKLLYVSISKGYKAGTSPSIVASSYTELIPVKQESLLSYEVGAKLTLLENRLQLDGAFFHYDYRNKQELGRVIDPLGVFGALQTLLNVPKSKEDGAELSAVWHPAGGWTLNTSVTYLNSKVTSNFINYSSYVLSAADTVNYKGESFPDTPRWTVHYGARYDRPLTDSLLAYVAADASYQSSTEGSFGAAHAQVVGAPSLAIKAYSLLNLAVGVQSIDKKWLVEAFGRNVTNTYYWNTAFWNGDQSLRFTGMPATYGVRLSYRY